MVAWCLQNCSFSHFDIFLNTLCMPSVFCCLIYSSNCYKGKDNIVYSIIWMGENLHVYTCTCEVYLHVSVCMYIMKQISEIRKRLCSFLYIKCVHVLQHIVTLLTFLLLCLALCCLFLLSALSKFMANSM